MSEVPERVFEMPMNYVCEKAVGPNRTCDFRSGKVILQQPFRVSRCRSCSRRAKTDLLDKFVSNRTNRAFKAFSI